jgi:RimJ/RimL family protein N-acetyltransferase
MADFAIETERLILREWREDDVAPLLAICTDPRVMKFLGPPQSEGETRAAIARQRGHQERLGHCYWALERKADSEMIGFCGLQPEPEAIPVIGGLPDIGWRLAHRAGGNGDAREAATASLDWGFANLADDTIWAITVGANTLSWGLMDRLGMTRHHDLDFDHPNVADDSPLKRHIAYGIDAKTWRLNGR